MVPSVNDKIGRFSRSVSKPIVNIVGRLLAGLVES